MKKNIEWVREQIKEERNLLNGTRYEKEVDDLTTGILLGLKKALNIINQLDEPEVLSQEWIDEHAMAVTYDEILDQIEIVYVDDLENLIIPKEESEVTLNRAFEKVSETYPMTKEEVYRHLEKFVAHGGRVTYGEPEVLSQELPVIPKYVADWITKHRDTFDLYPMLKRLEKNSSRRELTYKWYRTNTHEFVNAYLTGEYEVEEEPLYHALIKGHELIDSGKFYWNFDTFDGALFPSNRYSEFGRYLIEMSKSEWNKLGVNDSNADFIKVEEME